MVSADDSTINKEISIMSISTSQQAVTSDWVQVSAGDCTMQSSKSGIIYDVSVGEAQPTSGLSIKLDEPLTFAYKAPVWLRLNASGNASSQRFVNIIK